jgi:hypothetical protein
MKSSLHPLFASLAATLVITRYYNTEPKVSLTVSCP